MNWNDALSQLRDVLVDLYQTEDSSRVVVATALIDTRRIAFSTVPSSNWQAILNEAVKQGRMDALIAVVVKDYPNNIALIAAVESYRSQSQSAEPEPHKQITSLTLQQKTQLVDALLKTPSMSNESTRSTLVDELPADLRDAIVYSSIARVHVLNIVSAAVNYGGLENLVEIVRFFERDSMPMRGVDTVMATL